MNRNETSFNEYSLSVCCNDFFKFEWFFFYCDEIQISFSIYFDENNLIESSNFWNDCVFFFNDRSRNSNAFVWISTFFEFRVWISIFFSYFQSFFTRDNQTMKLVCVRKFLDFCRDRKHKFVKRFCCEWKKKKSRFIR